MISLCKPLSPTKRAQCIALSNIGLTQQDISKRLGISQSTVSYTINRYRKQGDFNSRPRCGRPRVTTARTDALIRRRAVVNPTISASEIHSSISLPSNMPSVRTIQRRLLSECNMKCYRPAHKPRLSAKNIADRLSFARAHVHWSSDKWRKILFSDEASVSQFGSYTTFVRRPPNSRYKPQFVIPSVKKPSTVMIWGCMSACGVGGLWFMPPNTSINSAVYLDILKQNLPIWMPLLGATTFLHDGAPCHSSKVVRSWFDDQDFQLLPNWPGSSPDLNVIEQVWAKLKKEVANRKPSSVKALRAEIQDIWYHHITPAFCEKLVLSMPDRIQAVLQAKGGNTRF